MAHNLFWEYFKKQDFIQAQSEFDNLNEKNKQEVLAELFQKSNYHRQPVMVSVLRGTLHDDKNFDDFYKAWLPEEVCKTIESRGQVFQQIFPIPTRAINMVNINNPKEIMSIGISWVANKEEEKMLWEHIKNLSAKEDETNDLRHQGIEKTAKRELLGIYRVESDDNLGVAF